MEALLFIWHLTGVDVKSRAWLNAFVLGCKLYDFCILCFLCRIVIGSFPVPARLLLLLFVSGNCFLLIKYKNEGSLSVRNLSGDYFLF